jgi:hypothetical protein
MPIVYQDNWPKCHGPSCSIPSRRRQWPVPVQADMCVFWIAPLVLVAVTKTIGTRMADGKMGRCCTPHQSAARGLGLAIDPRYRRRRSKTTLRPPAFLYWSPNPFSKSSGTTASLSAILSSLYASLSAFLAIVGGPKPFLFRQRCFNLHACFSLAGKDGKHDTTIQPDRPKTRAPS